MALLWGGAGLPLPSLEKSSYSLPDKPGAHSEENVQCSGSSTVTEVGLALAKLVLFTLLGDRFP